MDEKKKIEVKEIMKGVKRLLSISQALNRIDTVFCSEQLSERQEQRLEKRKIKLLKEAEDIAQRIFGLKIKHQGDPRGISLYLVEDEGTPYFEGVPVA